MCISYSEKTARYLWKGRAVADWRMESRICHRKTHFGGNISGWLW